MTDESIAEPGSPEAHRLAVLKRFPHAEAIQLDSGLYTISAGAGVCVGLGVAPDGAWKTAATWVEEAAGEQGA